MAKLNSILFCDDIVQNSTGNINLMGVFDSIIAAGFPAMHKKFIVYCNIDVEPGDKTEFFKIVFEGQEIASSAGLEIADSEKQQFLHNVNNFPLPGPGKYTVEIHVDDKIIGSNYFIVKTI